MEKDFCIERGDIEQGDDLEIRALSKIYMRPIEIYAYSNQPMNVFNKNILEPIRLSYHREVHYNSVYIHLTLQAKYNY